MSHGHPGRALASDERLLVLHVDSGLGNRMCAIATYAAIARHVGRRFQVVWRVDAPIVDTPFETVFEGDLAIGSDALAALSDGRTRHPFSLESAVIELHLLARCHDVLGSYGSSFSRVASDLRGIRFHQVGFDLRSRW